MAAFYELQRQLKMERTAQSGTTTGAKMAVNRSRTFHFMLPAVYGACMENVTRKAAGKLSKSKLNYQDKYADVKLLVRA